jgi:hypothetical protein
MRSRIEEKEYANGGRIELLILRLSGESAGESAASPSRMKKEGVYVCTSSELAGKTQFRERISGSV